MTGFVSYWGMSLMEKRNNGRVKKRWKRAGTWGSTIKKRCRILLNHSGSRLSSGLKYQQLWFTVQMFQSASKPVVFHITLWITGTTIIHIGMWLILTLSVIISHQETNPVHHSLESTMPPERWEITAALHLSHGWQVFILEVFSSL